MESATVALFQGDLKPLSSLSKHDRIDIVVRLFIKMEKDEMKTRAGAEPSSTSYPS
jgi:hypothetical protein